MSILQTIPEDLLLTEDNQPEALLGGEPRPLLAYRDTRRATMLVRRTVVGPFVNRHNMDEDTITIQVHGEPHVRVPNRKLKAVEKTRVLRAARMAGLMPPEYLYNEVQEVEHLANPVSIVYGDGSNKTNEVAGVPSRTIFSQAVSFERAADVITRLTHNALSDEKTMRNVVKDKDGRTSMRTSLFETAYIREGTTFLSTVTIDTPTPDVLTVVLYGLQAGSYGAGSNVYGTNLRNELEGIAFTNHEIPLTPWSTLEDGESTSADDAVAQMVNAARSAAGEGHFLDPAQARTLQNELAGSRANVTQSLGRLKAHAKEYVDAVFGAPKVQVKPKAKA